MARSANEKKDSSEWVSKLERISIQSGERALALTDTGQMATACRHPRVRVVSRHDDTEYVECQDCGEVFDSEEFRDMEIEETVESEPSQEDA